MYDDCERCACRALSSDDFIMQALFNLARQLGKEKSYTSGGSDPWGVDEVESFIFMQYGLTEAEPDCEDCHQRLECVALPRNLCAAPPPPAYYSLEVCHSMAISVKIKAAEPEEGFLNFSYVPGTWVAWAAGGRFKKFWGDSGHFSEHHEKQNEVRLLIKRILTDAKVVDRREFKNQTMLNEDPMDAYHGY